MPKGKRRKPEKHKKAKKPKKPKIKEIPDLLAKWPGKVIFEPLQMKGQLSLQPTT
jgi:hypothetical protein